MNILRKNIGKTIPFTIASKKKNQMSRNKLNKGCKLPLQGKLQIIEERN
jgi:hypothetical protein